ncbi:MAG: hypothetical protein KJ906_02375 [Nanoarchaeota archaeon]|nr:hypothetical protein [Nanoarchaeota archaeon]
MLQIQDIGFCQTPGYYNLRPSTSINIKGYDEWNITRKHEKKIPSLDLEFIDEKNINIPNLVINRSPEIEKMLESDNDFFRIHNLILSNLFNITDIVKLTDHIDILVEKDPEIEDWEEITIDIKLKNKDFTKMNELWENTENRIRHEIRNIEGITKEKIDEINNILSITFETGD